MSLVLALRVCQGVLALAVLGLSGYVVNWYNMDTMTASPSSVNFLVFVPLFSIISIICLEVIPRFSPRASNPYAMLAVESLNVIFYFSGFIALAVFVSRLLFCRGSVCAAARADIVLSTAQFLLWSTTTALVAKDVFKLGFRKPAAGQQMKEVA